MDISTMRSYVRSVVDIDSSDISDDVMNRFLGEAYDVIVYSEKRWPFFEAASTFKHGQRPEGLHGCRCGRVGYERVA